MLRLDDISDLDTAKRVMQLLDGENKRLHDRVHALVLALAAARGEEGAEQYEIEIVRLQEQIAALNRRLFAASTEQQNKPRDADEPRERTKPPAAAREQTQLRFEEVVHELDDADRACTLCGKELKEWAGQSVEFPEIDIVQRSFVLKKHVQKKYTCSCGVAPVTAEVNRPGIPGGSKA